MSSTSSKSIVKKLVGTDTNTEMLVPSGFSISDLPEEILLHLFSYLDKKQLVSTIPFVCRHWHHLHTDPSLYQILEFNKFDPDTQLAAKMIKMATWLECLEMSFRRDTDELLSNIPEELPRLKTLVLRSCTGSLTTIEVSSDCLLDLFDRAPNIRNLKLHCSSQGSDLTIYKDIGLKLPLLRTVYFEGLRVYAGTCALQGIIQHCDSIEVLQFLMFQSANISDDLIAMFCDEFSDTLRDLNFGYCTSWTDLSVCALARCRHVRKLSLYKSEMITDAAIRAISSMPNLVELTICDATLVTVHGWTKFFEVPRMKGIMWLRLDGCGNVNNEVANEIAVNLRDLEYLSVKSCSVTCHSRLKMMLSECCRRYYG